MLTFYDSQNQPRVLGERVGSGGEGTVFFCEDFRLVAKIYHEPISEEKAEKLRWMAANKNERLFKIAAWVIDVLYDAPGGRIVGFLMPNVKAKEIHELYSLKSRRVYFPEATWHFLVHTAANLARAFHILHKNAHVMGDINHGNCVVLADGTVKLIDCDSYSIKTEKMRYTCEVGVTTHLAPELQGVNLRSVERLDRHDNFGLAVLIFQLLFLGRHPFAGNYAGSEDKSLEDCIREFRFAYGADAALKEVRQPPGTLALEAVSPRVALLFERAFLTEQRPEPREWIEALEDLAGNLEQCALHPGHLYCSKLAACPWCEIEAQTGLMLFPFITTGNHLNGEKPFNIFTIENLIASLNISPNLPVKPPPPAFLPPPSPEIVEAKKYSRKLILTLVPVHFFGLILLMLILGVAAAFYLGILLTFAAIYLINDSDKSLRLELEENLTDAKRKSGALDEEWSRAGVPQILDDDLVKIRKKVREYQEIQQKGVREMKLLPAELTRRELYKYLRSKPLADSETYGVSKKQQKILIGKDVKTAAEIEENRLRSLPQVDDDLIRRLTAWRERLETDFEKDARLSATLEVEEARISVETVGERRRIEKDIERLLILLRAGSVHLHRLRQQLFSKSEKLAAQILQYRSDRRLLGNNIAAIIILILITIFAPLFGAMNGFDSPAPRVSSTNVRGYGNGLTINAPPPAPKVITANSTADLDVPDENISDAEISDLSSAKRQSYAENLYSQAIEDDGGKTDYAMIEKKMLLAVRLKNNDTRFLNKLGDALYELEKYPESVVVLNRLLKLDSENIAAKVLIAINYLKMKKYVAATKILHEITDKNSSSYEGFFNLGLAYAGLKNYAKAAAAFAQAIKIKPNDAGSHYELGLCFYKLGSKAEARREYLILLDRDQALAERLGKEANFDK